MKKHKVGTRVKHTRRNGDVINAKVIALRDSARGAWLQIRGDVGGKTLALWVRPSQAEII